jgi:hypothetical protein
MLQTVTHLHTFKYMEVPSAYHLNAYKEMTRNGHLLRGNHFYAMTIHHTVTLNMLHNLLLEILLMGSDTRSQMRGVDLQEHIHKMKKNYRLKHNAGDESLGACCFYYISVLEVFDQTTLVVRAS